MLGLLTVSLLVVFGPGLLVGVAGALRGWILVGAAPVVTLGVIGVFGPVLPMLGIAWSPFWFVGVTAALAAVTLGIRVLLGRFTATPGPGAPSWSPAQHIGVAGAVLTAAGIGLLITKRASRDLTAVPQWHDSSFHGNAIRFISDTGRSSPSDMNVVFDPSVTNTFYPNGYHVLAATIRQVADFGVVPTMDIINGIVVGLFALSLVLVVKVCTGSPALCAAAGLLACSISTFPYDVQVWGPLLPFTLGIAVVPAFVALFCHVVQARAGGQVVLVAVSGLGLMLVHTTAAVTAAVLAVLFLAQRWVGDRRTVLRDVGLLSGVALVAVLFGAVALSMLLGSAAIGSTAGLDWPEEGTAANSLGQLIGSSRSDVRPQWWFTVLLVIGLGYLHAPKFRPVYWWLAGSAFFAGVYVLTASYTSPLQRVLAAAWSDDPFRLAAAAMLGMILLAAVGVVAVRDGVLVVANRVFGTRTAPAEGDAPPRRRLTTSGVALGVVIAAVAIVTDGFYLGRNTEQLARLYPDGPIVSTEKLEAMAWLAERVPPGSVVANDPLDGSPWMWAVEGIEPLFGSASSGRPNDGTDRAVVLQSLNRIDADPRIRMTVRDLGISFVFVSDGTVVPGTVTPQGLQGLDQVRALRAVYRAPSVQIYEVLPDAVSPLSTP